jgi:ribosomal protein L7/L12
VQAVKCEHCGAAVVAGDATCRYCGVLFRAAGAPVAATQAPRDELEARVVALLRDGNKIEAIKVFRQARGCGLREAKDAVEAIEARLRR